MRKIFGAATMAAVLFLTACDKHDEVQAKQKLHEAGQELKKAGQEVKQELKEAGQDVKQGLKKAKKEIHEATADRDRQ